MTKQKELEEAINEKRDEMIKIGLTKGLTSDETIFCSQELDELLNRYSRLLSRKRQARSKSLYFHLIFLQGQLYKAFWVPYRYLLGNQNR